MLYVKGDSIEINDASGSRNTANEEADGIMCLYPGPADTALDRNDMCLVLKLTDGRFSGIFGGDISSEVEKKLVNEYGDELSVDFYKANHHCSRYSSSADWIEALSPRWAAVSCAAENRYGHPADEAMDRLMDAKCRVFTQCKVVRLSIKRVLYMKTIDNDIKAGDFKRFICCMDRRDTS